MISTSHRWWFLFGSSVALAALASAGCGRAYSDSRAASPAPAAAERPGLGTEWGESRDSRIVHRSFERATPDRPNATAMLYYNDREGARAMTRRPDYREVGDAVLHVAPMNVTVSLTDDGGSPLGAFFAEGRTYAIGEVGRRYTIVVRNDADYQVEVVASVDGLDVIDGRTANYEKRGYLVAAYGTLEIEGFRQSADQVAAFRFGSVRDSYAARTGTDRNVGVIGVALFAPQGAAYSQREVDRRHDADPFPGNYAAPPRRR